MVFRFAGLHWRCEKKMTMVINEPDFFQKEWLMQEIIKKVHAHIPYSLLMAYLPEIVDHKINVEIYFSHRVLQSLDRGQCADSAAKLAEAGVKVTFHGPFVDLRPGALDGRIRQVSLERIRQALELAPLFNPLKIVCHPSFDERYYVNCDELWLKHSANFWRELSREAKGLNTMIALENVYEKEPDILRRLFERLEGENVCFCFDTGHFNAFATAPLEVWMQQMGGFIGHLHLHDNFGKFDEHLPVGTATFPFDQLFAALAKLKSNPTVTLEAHSKEHLWQSLSNLQKMPFLKDTP